MIIKFKSATKIFEILKTSKDSEKAVPVSGTASPLL
jgi:hypothetical protein